MARTVTFKGSPLTLVGRAIKEGEKAPPFKVTRQDLTDATLADFKGKAKVITSFPSIDTPVCDLQVKEFNKRARSLSKDAAIIGISRDLPFAQKRFCDEFDIAGVSVFSDYRYGSFGLGYGLLIKELNLLGRSVIIVDKDDIIRQIQIVTEITQAPDYDASLAALETALKGVWTGAKTAGSGHCVPCEGGIAPLPKATVEGLVAKHRGWTLFEDKKISKEFAFKDTAEARYFADTVSLIADEEGHHPVIIQTYTKIKISLTTHAAKGLTDNDFVMARIIDEVAWV